MKFKKIFGFIFKLSISAGLLTWLFSGYDKDIIYTHFNDVTLITLLLISIVFAATAFVLGYRWIIILQHLGTNLSLPEASRISIIGMFFNQFLPSTVGGDVVRVLLARRQGLPTLLATYSVVSDRIIGFVGLVVICVIGLPFMLAITNDPMMVYGVSFLVLGALGGIGVLFAVHFLSPRWKKKKVLEWIVGISNTTVGFFYSSWLRGGYVLAITCSLHVVSVLLLYIMALFISIEISLGVALILIPPTILVSAIPISVAGWGVREGAMILTLGMAGVASSDSIALSVFYGLSQALAGLIGGIIWISMASHRGTRSSSQP